MTSDGHEAVDNGRAPAAPAQDDDRPVVDDAGGDNLPDHLDLPLETPEADALDQIREELFDEDAD